MKKNCIVLLGPTAVGKTHLGVQLARSINSEIISADSRQVYRGLDIGSGKDLNEYILNGKKIPYHLIDIADLKQEYNVFNYQNDFYKVFSELNKNKIIPIVVGGTGLYLDSILRNYDMMNVPQNHTLRENLGKKSLDELQKILLSLKPNLHNKSDLIIRERVTRAIEIALYMQSDECKKVRRKMQNRPKLNALVLGTSLEREILRENIKARLIERFKLGMISEVENLNKNGVSFSRLESLGLEYRFISEYLEGKIKTQDELFEKLYIAICQFAKRQKTWFRGMEKKGVTINWISQENNFDARLSSAKKIISENLALE